MKVRRGISFKVKVKAGIDICFEENVLCGSHYNVATFVATKLQNVNLLVYYFFKVTKKQTKTLFTLLDRDERVKINFDASSN